MNDKFGIKNEFVFNWLLRDKLAIGTSPTKIQDVNLLKKNKVKNILGLCTEAEAKWHIDLENNFSCSRVILPDSNKKRLPSLGEITNAYKVLINFFDHDITFVHCFASIERSPLVCIMLIMRKYNLDVEESLDYVKQMHKIANPRNNQLLLIKNYNFNDT